MAKDMLFATLDPTMRSIRLPAGDEVILSDTVGFISDLPTELVAAFRATLEEVLAADLILHVRDISHAETAEQAEDVASILAGLGITDETPQIEVWNKIDLVPAEDRASLKTTAARSDGISVISALSGDGVAPLLAEISECLAPPRRVHRVQLGFHEGRKRAWLYDGGLVDAERQTETGFELEVRMSDREAKKLRDL